MKRINHISGFTLVEVLVAMALLAMLMLALGSTLRAVAQVEMRIEKITTANEVMTSVGDFLRQIMESISARRSKSINAGQPDAVQFAGTSNQVNWVGVMPARHGAGGRYRFSLLLDTQEGNTKLVLQYYPVTDKVRIDDPIRTEDRVVAEYVTEFKVEYLIEEVDAVRWIDAWTKTDKIPNAIRIHLTTDAGRWPEFIVRVRPLAPSDRSRSIFTMGGD